MTTSQSYSCRVIIKIDTHLPGNIEAKMRSELFQEIQMKSKVTWQPELLLFAQLDFENSDLKLGLISWTTCARKTTFADDCTAMNENKFLSLITWILGINCFKEKH
jgi:hypothetical protein